MRKIKKVILVSVLFLILGAVAPCGDVFADTVSNSSDVKTTTTFRVPNSVISGYSVNSINESKAYAPSGGGVSFGGVGFGGIGFGGGTSTAIGAGAVGTGAAIHYMSRGKKKRSNKVKPKYRHPHKSAEHTKNASPSHKQKHTDPRAGQSDKKKRQHGRYR